MDKNKRYTCNVCNTDIELINKISHESGKKHKNKLQYFPHCIFVNGFPFYTQRHDLIKAFSQFGSVKVGKLNKNFAVLSFNDEQACEAAIRSSKQVILYGMNLFVRRYTTEEISVDNNENQPVSRELTRSRQKEIIIQPNAIDLSGDFDAQCQAIFAAVRLTREQVEGISLLYSNLTEVFQCLWPGCVAVPFGSITTGLGITTSDADCFIDIPKRFRYPGANFVTRAKKLLMRYPKIFCEVLGIPQANTPIVKFFHIPTEINCDISFKTPLGARNSALINFLLRTDQRVLYLCILLKYWAKIHDLTGTGKLSNYALTILIIYYLQQHEPAPLLPSVQMLQDGLDYFIDGWNTGFLDQHQLLPPTDNHCTLSELLGGFFLFYRKFNFKEDIVCPYLGIAVKKAHFEKTESVNDTFHIYKHNVNEDRTAPLRVHMEMCIQDPFEHSRNVSSCVGFKLFNIITQTVNWAAELYDKGKKRDDGAEYLRNILTQKPKIQVHSKDLRFKIVITQQVLKNLPEYWKDMVVEEFHMIFRDILQFSIAKQDTDKGAEKESKKDEIKKVNNKKENYLCKASNIVWRRKQLSKMYDAMNMDFLAKQIKVTKDILNLGQDPRNISMHVSIELMFFEYENQRRCHIFMRSEKDEGNLFEEFGRFCVVNVSQWFPVLLGKRAGENNKVSSSDQTGATSSGNSEREEEAEDMQCETPQIIADSESDTPEDDIISNEFNVSHASTMSQDIPKPKMESREHLDFSPDTNPPMKMFKKE